jgi:hypothetical protein
MAHTYNKTKADILCDRDLNERRFKTVLSVLRLGGVPLNMKSVSRVNTAYNVFIISCYYVTMLCLTMDTYANSDQPLQTMRNYRVLAGMQATMCMHLCLRYSTTI